MAAMWRPKTVRMPNSKMATWWPSGHRLRAADRVLFPHGLVPEAFDREMGCSEVEWLRWLPEATAPHRLSLHQGGATVFAATPMREVLGASLNAEQAMLLELTWKVLPARRIALLEISRLLVSFQFKGIDVQDRVDFMRRFDLTMQRGGG
jgi:hypothetical protein